MTRANATFESLGFLQSVGENWQSNIGPNLYQTLESGFIIQILRVNALHYKRISIQMVANLKSVIRWLLMCIDLLVFS